MCRRLFVVESEFRIYFAVAERIRKTPQKPLLLWGSGGEQGIRTLEQVIARYTISNRAPSTSSDNSPYLQIKCLFIIYDQSEKIKSFFNFIYYEQKIRRYNYAADKFLPDCVNSQTVNCIRNIIHEVAVNCFGECFEHFFVSHFD